ncbi:MAG: hypothetical protein K9G26_02790 [Emcibacter sp.]|nr:hypothetical protein [Emcibacter sp.]
MPKNRPQTLRRLKILIRLDADHHVGLAHGVRISKILAFGQSKYGSLWDFDISLIGNIPHYDKFFDTSCPVYPLSQDQGTEEERAQMTLQVAKESAADILLVDHPHLTKISWDIFSASNLPLIAIDDEGGDVIADLIFNGTILETYHHYPEMKHKDRIKAGEKYALINPVFKEIPWVDANDLSLITVIGGGDRACEWALKLTSEDGALSKFDSYKKTMIVGGSFPEFSKLRKNCEAYNIDLHQGLSQHSMAKLLCEHSIGLITGGMIVYEALSMGLPIIIFPQEKNLPPEAHYFAKQGCAIDLGYENGMNMAIVTHEIMALMKNKEKRMHFSQKSKALIDGKGMVRTIETLNVFFDHLQKNNLEGIGK